MCRRVCVLALFLGLLHPARAQADAFLIDLTSAESLNLDFSGTFLYDNDVALIQFLVTSESVVTIQTTSYADGGFDSLINLFDSNGERIPGAESDIDDRDPDVLNLDPYLSLTLGTGLYTLALSQTFNDPGFSLTDPFAFDGTTDFERQYTRWLYDPAEGIAPCESFITPWDPDGPCRSGNFAGTIAIAPTVPTTVPEPASLVLMATGLTAGLLRRPRRRRHRPD